MTPENREYILTLLDRGLSPAEICEQVCIGCDCLPCQAIDEYATWVYIGEYTQDNRAEPDRVPPKTPKPRLVTFDTMYHRRIPRMWKKYRADELTVEAFYQMNDALILHETRPRQGVSALKELLGPAFCMTRPVGVPVVEAPLGVLNMRVLN